MDKENHHKQIDTLVSKIREKAHRHGMGFQGTSSTLVPNILEQGINRREFDGQLKHNSFTFITPEMLKARSRPRAKERLSNAISEAAFWASQRATSENGDPNIVVFELMKPNSDIHPTLGLRYVELSPGSPTPVGKSLLTIQREKILGHFNVETESTTYLEKHPEWYPEWYIETFGQILDIISECQPKK